MHVLPQLREIEARWPNEIAVVGVHSGKYIAERETSRIRDACARLGVAHPVVNDRQFRVWRSFAVRAWPTLVIIDPEGYVVGMRAGEFTAEQLTPFIEATLTDASARGALRPSAQHVTPEGPSQRSGILRFPDKVTVARDRIAIADSGHHRVLVATLDPQRRSARIELTIGRSRGFEDGVAEQASFDSPRGLTFAPDERGDDLLWVADAGNHAVRTVRLSDGLVRTVGGIGRRVRTRTELAAGAMASPWDVAVAQKTLHLAMAGTHQLWAAPIGSQLRPRSGSGAEELHDAVHGRAALAQPMGLAVDVVRERIWFADAESSAIRWADSSDAGAVHTVVGTGLFDFGDRDGKGDEVRLQHPQGVALLPDGHLVIADSYNDALKRLDPDARRVTTWLRGFSEPGGLCVDDGVVYIADTNAHRIAVASLDSKSDEVRTLELIERE